MKLVLERRGGEGASSASAGSMLVRWGNPPAASSGPCYTIDWTSPSPRATLTLGSHSLPVALLQKSPELYSFSHEVFGSIIITKRPWFAETPLESLESGVQLGFQGWYEGCWYDGPYAVWNQGRLTDLIMPGGDFRLELEPSLEPLCDVEAWVQEQRIYAWKQSLLEAVRRRGAVEAGTLLTGDDSWAMVLNLLLFRLAFPGIALAMLPKHQGWRRLAQNLNIEPLRRLDPKRPRVAIDLEWGSPTAVREILDWQLKQSPFVPGKLWKELCSVGGDGART